MSEAAVNKTNLTRAALCVGINNFKNLPQSSWLHGCVNDANDLAALLREQYGFAPGDVTVLVDAEASKTAVLGALNGLVERAERGDLGQIVFTFSSHGTQIPDTNGDEADGLDECFACYDIDSAGDSWNKDTVIVDDELHELLLRLPASARMDVVLDTCHSGTGLRALDLIPGRRPRFLPPPTPEGLRSVETLGTTKKSSLKELSQGTNGADGVQAVLMAACRDDQTATDAFIDGRYNGAFTYHFVRTLKSDGALSRAELLQAVSKALKEGRFDQVVQLEATAAQKKASWGS
ncbi:caspase family protein [Arthrobacter sp. MMS24-S77]